VFCVDLRVYTELLDRALALDIIFNWADTTLVPND